MREHLLIGVQYGRPVPFCLQQHRNGPHFQTGDTEGEVRVSSDLFISSVCSGLCVVVPVPQSENAGSVCVYRPAEEPTTWGGYLGKVLMASTTYLPSQVTEMFTQGRAFATVRLPFCGHKNICALAV